MEINTNDLIPPDGSENPYGNFAVPLFARGWPPILCHPGQKRPVGNGWRPPRDIDEVSSWAERMPRGNIGLAPGNGVLWIDFDFSEPEIMAATRRVVSASPIGRKGATGVAEAFHQPPGGPLTSFKLMRGDRPGKPLIEVFASSGFVIVPPSRHPDGPFYRWTTPDNPMTLLPGDLPSVPSTLETELRLVVARWIKPLVELSDVPMRPSGEPLSGIERKRYAARATAALASYRRQISALGKGGRSFRTYVMAKSLAPYVREGFLDDAEIHAAAMEAAQINGFLKDGGNARQVHRDVNRGLLHGRDHPLPVLKERPYGWGRAW